MRGETDGEPLPLKQAEVGYLCPVDRSVFAQHFLAAAKSALEFSRQFLEEPLPDEMIFRVHLNSSHDVHARPDVRLFPEDSLEERARTTKQLDSERVWSNCFGAMDSSRSGSIWRW